MLAAKYGQLLVGYIGYGTITRKESMRSGLHQETYAQGLSPLGLSCAFIRDPACLTGFVTFDGFTGFESRRKPICSFPMWCGPPGRGIAIVIGFCPTRTIKSVDVPINARCRPTRLQISSVDLESSHRARFP